MRIPDGGTATSTIDVSGLAGNAPAALRVAVRIKHPWRGDLAIDLVAADGSRYRLKNASNEAVADLDTTYTVNASGEPASGAWKLSVQDTRPLYSGYIDSWKLAY